MRDSTLTDAIACDPDNVDNYLVYADWLAARGDPRGELIAVQHHLSLDPDSPALQAAQAQLLEDHRAALTCEGVCAGAPELASVELDWRLGFWRAARVELEPDASSTAGVAALLAHPSAAVLESLTIHGATSSTGELFRELALMLGEPELPVARTLRALALGERDLPLRWSPALLERALPRLEQLELRSSNIHHSYLDWSLPRLRSFTLVTRSLGRRRLARLYRSLPPKLRALTLDLRDPKLRVADLDAILDGSLCPRLTRLGLLGLDQSAAMLDALLRSPLLPQLHAIGVHPLRGWWSDDELSTHLRDPALAAKQLFCSCDADADDLYNFGLLLRSELERPADALAAYDQALRLAPDDVATWMEHGNALDDLDRLPEAERSYREALRLDPEHEPTWHNLAVGLKRQRRFAEALDGYRRSCASREPSASTLHCIGHMLQELGDEPEARQVLDAAIAKYSALLSAAPANAEAMFWRAAARARLQQRDEALADLRRAIELDDQWRTEARDEEDFIGLREDPDFLALLTT